MTLVHWDSNGYATYSNSIGGIDVTKYHVYAIEWDEEYITWYCDDKEVNKILIKDNVGGTEEFHKNFFILLNLAVGGNWPQNPNGTAKFPASMYVDYVRVYQLNNINDNSSTNKPSSEPTSTSNPTNDNPSSTSGITSINSSTIQAYIKNTIWADLHYTINNQTQMNVRMQQDNENSYYKINNLHPGDKVTYWFTYWSKAGYAIDTSETCYQN